MYQTHRTYIKADMKLFELIKENPRLLFLLEQFNIDFAVGDKTVSQICSEHAVSPTVFLLFANLYNGFHPDPHEIQSDTEIKHIICFLKNSHKHYKVDRYPEIIACIKDLQNKTGNEEVKLIEHFFEEYFHEVLEHLGYEDQVAFPYFIRLIEGNTKPLDHSFSVKDYREHHSDIETKLSDLKHLLLKHIYISQHLPLRRKLYLSLSELEFDLQIHALIEDTILLPVIAEVERNSLNG